ncbi:hypothetical protein IGI04_013874 [Brassica rapa subsp. trilocularis]|uniref:Secreted protein n=1 Tax=Brassica rapa subsp. trilocularis TaxID=1813537 RepID=A0ABQ7NCG4_BRACM|nr:hypothetical protein IGI04_013874 [Brassica rapa subsp. trilocularis]
MLRSLIRGEVRAGCNRSESVWLCFFVCALLFDSSGRLWPLDDSQFAPPFFCCSLLRRHDLILRQFCWQLKRALARLGMWLKASCGVSYIPAFVRKASWRSSGTSYSGDVKGTPCILGNEENLTFPRVTSTVENGYQSRRISKNKLAECAGFSGRAKLGL